jgi:hypothetical protein
VAVGFDREAQKLQVIPGVEPQNQLEKWTEDGKGLLWFRQHRRKPTSTVWTLRPERSLLETVEPSEKAGSTQNARLAYAVDSKTYVYSVVRVLGTLYLVEGLE